MEKKHDDAEAKTQHYLGIKNRLEEYRDSIIENKNNMSINGALHYKDNTLKGDYYNVYSQKNKCLVNRSRRIEKSRGGLSDGYLISLCSN